MTTALLEAEGLTRHFVTRKLFGSPPPVQAVNGVDLKVDAGEIVGLVGESGSGKSTVGRLLLGLQPLTAGQVRFGGRDLATLGGDDSRRLRQQMQLIFQDPYSSLDPRRRIGAQIADGLVIHRIDGGRNTSERVGDLLDQVGLERSYASRYPHEFSGGQRQRIAIARALATNPAFIVADEPVSALDVSVQAQVLKLLSGLRDSLKLAILFISHDLGAVRHLCDRVVVLYLGRVMEQGPVDEIFRAPAHPYTEALLSAVPKLDAARRQKRIILKGDPPSPARPPSGCVFRTRCLYATDECARVVPPLVSVNRPDHRAACIRLDAIAAERSAVKEPA